MTALLKTPMFSLLAVVDTTLETNNWDVVSVSFQLSETHVGPLRREWLHPRLLPPWPRQAESAVVCVATSGVQRVWQEVGRSRGSQTAQNNLICCRDLTLSIPVVSYGYASECSRPYWSNPPFLIFRHSFTLALSPELQSERMSKIKNGGLDQYGVERFGRLVFATSEKVWDWKG